jgi:ribonucleoside-diphosphate reductase alpha chain
MVKGRMESNYRFPPTRHGLTRKFNCGLDVYLTVNPKPDGEPGEVFVKCGKEGSTVSGLVQAWVVTISAALQRGVPWDELKVKYLHTRFDPQTNEYSSLVDAVARNIDDLREELRKLVRERMGQQELEFRNGEQR